MSKRKSRKIAEWLSYSIGFSGKGPTLLDEKPKRQLGRKEKIKFNKLLKEFQFEKDRRANAFRMACIDVLGEDPDCDWD